MLHEFITVLWHTFDTRHTDQQNLSELQHASVHVDSLILMTHILINRTQSHRSPLTPTRPMFTHLRPHTDGNIAQSWHWQRKWKKSCLLLPCRQWSGSCCHADVSCLGDRLYRCSTATLTFRNKVIAIKVRRVWFQKRNKCQRLHCRLFQDYWWWCHSETGLDTRLKCELALDFGGCRRFGMAKVKLCQILSTTASQLWEANTQVLQLQ